jgi:hypothetical protein
LNTFFKPKESTAKRTRNDTAPGEPTATKKVKSVLSETNGNIITEKGVDPFKDFYDYKSSSEDEDEEDGDYTG